MILMLKKTLHIVCASMLLCGININAQSDKYSQTAAKSKEQREMMIREFGITDQQGIIIQQLSRKRTLQIDSLVMSGVTGSELKEQTDAITDEYYLQVSKILTEKELQWFDADALKAARSEEVTSLGLSPRMSVEMGKLKAEFKKSRAQITASGMPYTVTQRNLKELVASYHNKVKSLIGIEHYEAWESFNNSRIERSYIRKYGFTPEQIAAYSPDAFNATQNEEIKMLNLSPETALMMGELIVAYQERVNMLIRQKLSKDETKREKEEITTIHYNNIKMLLGEEKYKLWATYLEEKPRRIFMKQNALTQEQVALYDIDVFRIIKGEDIRSLNLPPLTALKMGELKLTYMRGLKSLPENKKERKAQRQALEEKYRNDLYQLLGNNKFSAWEDYQNKRIEITYREKYGFSKEQFERFQELENMQAIEISKIKNTAIPKDLKKAKIQKAKDKKVQQMKQILSADQFSKWYKDYQQKEEKRNMNR